MWAACCAFSPPPKALTYILNLLQLRAQLLFGSVGLVLAVLIIGGSVDVVSRRSAGPVALYDIPNFIAERTQTHFPMAEENWLNMAAEGKIGDDVKPQNVLDGLNTAISDARTHALQENYEARVKAKVDALQENYDTYDVHKGKVIHKMYGREVGAPPQLTATSSGGGGSGPAAPDLTNGVTPTAVPALHAGPVALSAATADREASQMLQLAQPQTNGGMMYKQQQLAQIAPQEQSVFGVKVPEGLTGGQKFIAQVPGHGQMLVYVPKGAKGGDTVAIRTGAAAAPSPTARRPAQHRVVFKAAPAPRRAAPAAHKATVQPSVVPFASGRKGYYEDMRAEAHAERFTRARHPLADRMFDEALQSHYNMRSSTFGLEH
jgi:hypothetical protein